MAILLIGNSFLFTQSKWEIQNPWPTGTSLWSLWPVDQNKVFFTGVSTLFNTNDGGTSWVFKSTPSEYGGQKIFFLNSLTGWIISSDKIARTSNGGDTWEEVSISIDRTKYYFSDLFFLNDRYGWAVLSSLSSAFQDILSNPGKLYKTEDGGNSWIELPINAKGEFFNIFTKDGRSIFVTGTDSVSKYGYKKCLFSSDDSGSTWQEYLCPDNGDKSAKPIFTSEKKGWVGPYETLDGGKTWLLKSPGENLYFVDSLNAYSFTDTVLYKSTDAGESWNKVFTGEQYFTFTDIRMYDKNVGWICGIRGVIYKTIDGGKNWVKRSRGYTENLYGVDFIDEKNGWSVGSNGTVLHTSDGGKNWASQYGEQNFTLLNVKFVNSADGLAAGYQYVIRTTDGGNTWNKCFYSKGININDIQFINNNLGWIAGNNGLVAKTTDGGFNWTTQTTGKFYPFWSITFADSLNGWIGGLGPSLSTSDGGNTWNENQNIQGISKIRFWDKDHGWATNDDEGGFFRTKDGGQNWESIPIENYLEPLKGMIKDFQFFNKDSGWAISYFFPKVAKTSDGGFTWVDYEMLPLNRIESLKFINPNTGWVVGNSGSILFYKNQTSDVKDHTQSNNEPNEFLSVYPNPFNNAAKIHFVNPHEQILEIKIYNLLGQEILNYPKLVYKKGAHDLTFNASEHPSGLYFIMIKGNNYLQTTKCILLK